MAEHARAIVSSDLDTTAWHPWHTAPRDARIDAWHRDGYRVTDVHWDQELGRWISPARVYNSARHDDLVSARTHWRWPPRGPNGEAST